MAAVGAIHGQCFDSVMLVSPQEIMFAVQAALGWMADPAVYMWNVECGMWNVECGMWNVECGMIFSV
jgi:hypothetical protein